MVPAAIEGLRFIREEGGTTTLPDFLTAFAPRAASLWMRLRIPTVLAAFDYRTRLVTLTPEGAALLAAAEIQPCTSSSSSRTSPAAITWNSPGISSSRGVRGRASGSRLAVRAPSARTACLRTP